MFRFEVGYYAGPKKALLGERAILQKVEGQPDRVMAQFDNRLLADGYRLTEEQLSILERQSNSGDPPSYLLGFGWHLFERADFDIVSDPEEK